MVRGLQNLIYYQGMRIWEEGLKIKGKFHGVRSEGGLVVVSSSWSERDVSSVICGTRDKKFCELYTGQGPRQGAMRSMVGVWVSEEVPSHGGYMAQSHGDGRGQGVGGSHSWALM